MGKTPSPGKFLAGGGTMGEWIRKHDWSATPLGPMETWPQSLLTTLSIVLHSRFPKVLFWGPQATAFYNDAYSPVLAYRNKHPWALGKPAQSIWPERWNFIAPILNNILAGGAATYTEDQLIPTIRDGRSVDIYWTTSYSHVLGEDGEPAGVMCTCTETTEKVVNFHRLEESDRNFRNTVKQAPVGIVIFEGRHFTVTMANSTYLQIIDKTEAELVGKPFFDTLPELREQVQSLLMGVLLTGIPYYGYEFPVTLIRNGRTELTYFNFVYQPLRNEDSSVTGIIVVATEVTETARARQALAESEKRFRDYVMQSPIPMTIFKGEDFIVDLANPPMFRKLWRRSESQVLGRKILEIFPELNDQKYPALLKQVYTTGITHRETESPALVAGDDGMKQFYLDYEYQPLKDTLGAVWGIMVTVTDMTDHVESRRKIEAAEQKARQAALELEVKVEERTRDLAERSRDLQESNLQLERSNEDLQQFAHVTSHDLVEPVRKIKIFSHRLRDEHGAALGDSGQVYLDKILKATNRIFEMIHGILRYSALPGSEQLVRPVDLDAVIKNIQADLEIPIQERQATIVADPLPTIPAMPDLIYQLFYNLLNNALKFAKKDAPARITIGSTYTEIEGRRFLQITVADNGIGFSNENAELIFSTFSRLHSKDKYEGTGLGLALCKKIVQRHGGFITARGEMGVGAEFTILLPATSNI